LKYANSGVSNFSSAEKTVIENTTNPVSTKKVVKITTIIILKIFFNKNVMM
jgi:hypothetical protein